jgi:hypothetical protein
MININKIYVYIIYCKYLNLWPNTYLTTLKIYFSHRTYESDGHSIGF